MWRIASDSLPLNGLGQLGAVGAVLTIFLTFGWLILRREQIRADRLETEKDALNVLIREKYVPSLEESTTALRESTELIAILRDQLRGRR